MADMETGAAEQPADLRSLLASVADEEEARVERETTPSTEESGVEQTSEEPADKGKRTRGPDGKFLAAEKEGAETEKPVAETKPEETTATEQKAPETKPTGIQAPQHWSQTDKAWLASIPAEHQQSVLDRFKQMEAGFTPKLQRLAAIERDFGPAVEMFVPHIEALRSRNMTPASLIQAWAGVEKSLVDHKASIDRGGPDAGGAQVVANIIRAYNVNPAEIAALLTNPQHQQAPAQPQVPPELMTRLQTLENAERERIQRGQLEKVDTVQRQIDTFANAKGDDGSLTHPFFAELEQDMMALARLDMAAGKTPDLPDLYDRAVYANRETRTKLLSLNQEAEAKRAAAERKAKSEAASRAAVSVTGSRGNTAPTQRSGSQGRSLRDEIVTAAEDLDAA
jgi:hypothetical protein